VSVPLHHVAQGPADAPVLLLGNALGTDITVWDGVVPRLRDRFRVVRFDLRGQGGSPVPHGAYDIAELGEDVVALLDGLEVERAAFCGVSLGGMVGLWLGAHAPERLDRLVVCCTSAHPGNPAGWADRAAVVRAAGSTDPIADAVVARWLTAAHAADHPTALAALRAMLVASPAAGYAACCDVLQRLDLRPDLERIRVPTLVVAGALDEALPPAHGRVIADGVPDARFALVPLAHLPMAERPLDMADLILEHLEVPA
jgi:3-oxoadipate enol-lactonase